MVTGARCVVRWVAGIAVSVSLVACGGAEKSDVRDLLSGAPPTPTAVMGNPVACAQTDGPAVDIPSADDFEPRMRIPQPPGWVRNTQLDSQLVRFVLMNQALTADQFTPNVVVTVEKAPATDARTIYDQARKNLVKLAGATDVSAVPADVCGLPAEKVTYRSAATGAATAERSLTTLYVATRDGDRSNLISVTIQTTRPDNPTYQRDAALMLDGFEVLPSPAGAP
ncbi:LpqN/LpqT family lipoprotein [Mycobacterium sp. WMMD1722]|uniref:LpqN/LpqT family lipoprotein n=1 Tax=Mycobacterium sp. WMMD1722 TaxID=3404117 RepID=UPI003BF52EC6